MPKRSWSGQYKTHEITLTNHWSFVPGKGQGEALFVDGEPVLQGKHAGPMDMAVRLDHDITLSGENVRLSGLVVWDGYKQLGQIRIDDQVIGGDTSLGRLEQAPLQKAVGPGWVRYVLLNGILALGVPFGIAMATVNAVNSGADWGEVVQTGLVTGLFYGVVMGLVFFFLQRRAFRRLYGSDAAKPSTEKA